MERFWNPLSVNWDMHGLKYISTIEVINACHVFLLKQRQKVTLDSLSNPLLRCFHFYIFAGKTISVCGSPVPSWEEHLWVVCKGAKDSTHEVMIMATAILMPMFIGENPILDIWKKLRFCPNQGGRVLHKPKCFVRKFDETLDTAKSMKKKIVDKVRLSL